MSFRHLLLSSFAFFSAQAFAHGNNSGGTCWYFNKYSHTIVDFDAFGQRKSCDPHGNWYEQCRDRKPVTAELGCRWQNLPAPKPSDMPAGMDMNTGVSDSSRNPIDMPVGNDMGANSGWGNNGSMNPDNSMGTGGNQVPTLASLGVSFGNGQPTPANWEYIKAVGVRVDPKYHACTWAVRPIILAFPDGVIYANNDEQNLNVFDHQLVRSFGCIVPSINGRSVQAPVTEPLNKDNTYTGESRRYQAASLASFGLYADGKSHPRDGRFNEIMAKALRIAQIDHRCKWAVRPLIYVFTDGIAYASIGGTDFNLFPADTVRGQGCFVPAVAPLGTSVPSSPIDMPSTDNMPTGIPGPGVDPSSGMDMGSSAGVDGLNSMGG